jgi:hypothetical protein
MASRKYFYFYFLVLIYLCVLDGVYILLAFNDGPRDKGCSRPLLWLGKLMNCLVPWIQSTAGQPEC